MALTFQQTHGTSNAVATTWITQNLTVGSLLLCAVFMQNGTSDILSISDGANTWAQLTPIYRNGSTFGGAIWYCQSNTLATKPTVTVTLTSGSPFTSVTVIEYTGQASSSPLDAVANASYASNASSQSIPAGPVQTNFTNETLIGLTVLNSGSSGVTADPNFTGHATGTQTMFEDMNVSSQGSYTCSPTETLTNAAAITRLLAIKTSTSTSGGGNSNSGLLKLLGVN